MESSRELAKGNSSGGSEESCTAELEEYRCFHELLEGVETNLPKIESSIYDEVHNNLHRIASHLEQPSSNEQRREYVRSYVRELADYKSFAERERREGLTAWKSLCDSLLRALLENQGVDLASPPAYILQSELAKISTLAALREYNSLLKKQLGTGKITSAVLQAHDQNSLSNADRNQISGLPGNKAALEKFLLAKEQQVHGFVVLFKLGCLGIIERRFGREVMQSAVTAVASFIAAHLQASENLFHWKDEVLLAICESRINEQDMDIDLQRILRQNKEITVNASGRNIMVKIPLLYEFKPIQQFNNAEELDTLA